MLGPAGCAEPVASGSYGFADPRHEVFPPILIVAVTNLCDMACVHCAHPMVKKSEGYRGAFMDPEIHTRIVEETRAYADQLWVFRYAADGESLLHPKFLDFVEEAKRAGIGPLDLTTNAMSLTEIQMRRLLEAPVDVIDVSLDALTPESYAKIRIRGKFEVVTANLRRLVELRDRLGSPTRIMTSIIRQKDALHEVDAFVAHWGALVDEVLVRGLNTDLGIVNAAETYFDHEQVRWPCPQFWKRVTINHDGGIRFCVEDWFNRGVVANLRESSIREVWQSPAYRQFRELHASGRWAEVKMCGPCMDWQHMEWGHGFEKAVSRVLGRPLAGARREEGA